MYEQNPINQRQLTDTHRLIPCCFEAIGADAAEAPQSVDALTRIADTWILNAFVAVWKGEKQLLHCKKTQNSEI